MHLLLLNIFPNIEDVDVSNYRIYYFGAHHYKLENIFKLFSAFQNFGDSKLKYGTVYFTMKLWTTSPNHYWMKAMSSRVLGAECFCAYFRPSSTLRWIRQNILFGRLECITNMDIKIDYRLYGMALMSLIKIILMTWEEFT